MARFESEAPNHRAANDTDRLTVSISEGLERG